MGKALISITQMRVVLVDAVKVFPFKFLEILEQKGAYAPFLFYTIITILAIIKTN